MENKASIYVSSAGLRHSSSNTALIGGAARLAAERYLKRSLVVLLFALGATAAGARPPQAEGDVKVIDVIASRFKFEPESITVAQGDSVRLRLHSTDRSHGIAIKAFRVKALIPKTGETVTVEFVADRPGTFDVTCSEYCGTGHGGMKGRLVVLAREK